MKLYIDISQIMNFINKIKEQRSGLLVCSCIEKGNIFEFSFKENGKEGLITFYFNKDGYTTCRASNKNKKAEGEILDLLAKDKSTYAKFEDLKPFVLNVVRNGDNLEEIINFLQKVSKNYVETKNGSKFTSKYGESIFIVNYKTKFVIQGKSGFLLAQLLPYIQSITEGQTNEIYNIYLNELTKNKSLTLSDFENVLKQKMPIAYPLINSHIISLIIPSIMLIHQGIDIPDYCAYVFPVYRGIEGCLRQLLKECNVSVDKTFGCFDKSKTHIDRYELKGKGTYTKNQKSAIEMLYNYFKNKRNPVFHTENDLEATTIIEDRNVAKSHIYDTLNIIEDTFKLFNI